MGFRAEFWGEKGDLESSEVDFGVKNGDLGARGGFWGEKRPIWDPDPLFFAGGAVLIFEVELLKIERRPEL